MTSTSNISPRTMIDTIFGPNFPGYITLWERQGKTTQFFSVARLDQLEQEIERLAPTNDLYIGVGTQEEQLGPRSRGKGATTLATGSFFADIDFASSKDNGKAYPPDEETALRVLSNFVHRPTFIIRTGNGLHVHWVFKKPLTFQDPKDRKAQEACRRGFAGDLSQVFQAEGYELDGVQDLARVCRIPRTLNHKSKPPKPVEVISFDDTARIDPTLYEPVTNRQRQTATRRAGPPAHHDRIARRCGWYSHYTGAGAAECPEPEWYALASVTGRTIDGEQHFHAYSRTHPKYDEREAAAKYARGVSEAGPRTCRAIRDGGNERFCSACPEWGTITSPIELGRAYHAGERGPRPVGFTNQGTYALLDQQRQILLLLTANQLLDFRTLLGLAERAFWEANFPDPRGGFNAQAAGEAVIAACKGKGPFDPKTVRGRGIWLEGDRVIVNLGGPIPEDTKFLYICFEPLQVPDATGFPTERLLKLLRTFPWRHQADALLLLGWLAVAAICGALKWRPHCFAYGPPNSGKSTLHSLVSDLLYPLVVPAEGQSTEAGIRQTLGPDSMAVVIDEFETDHRQERLAAVMRFARSASSAEVPVLRGTQSGQALQYSVRTSLFFSAVNVGGMSQADETRILMLELTAHADDADVGRFIVEERHFFADMGPLWCAWMVANVSHLAHAIETFEMALPKVNSRHRTNMSTLMAGAFIALHGRAPTPDEAGRWVVGQGDAILFHGQAHERHDASDALAHLLGHLVTDIHGQTFPLGHWLATDLATQASGRRPNGLEEAGRIVAIHGMQFILTGDQPGLMIRHGSPAIDKIFQGTKWANRGWQKALGQIPGAFRLANPIRFPGFPGKDRAVGLSLELIPPPLDGRATSKEF